MLKTNVGTELSHSTINSILRRNNLISPEKSARQTPPIRFEYEKPNQLWQMDFKGGFVLLDKSSCFPLTILDDHSRFNLCLKASSNQIFKTVQEGLITTFRKYGLPDKILTDNGPPWGAAGHYTSSGEVSLSALEIWLIRLNIQVLHGRPYHPQTQGKEERFHRTLKTELLQFEKFKNIDHCQRRFNYWRNKYNQERPHEAIGFKTPANIYTSSSRSFKETLPQIEYNQEDIVRNVGRNGCINIKNQVFKVGKGLINQPVAIRQTALENVLDVYFCNQKIKQIIRG